MATVYLAKDRKHDRPVAVKVLKPELAASLGPARFLQEIRFGARLAHPHILPLHDSREADGFLYYVMPFVEGESLRDRLTQEQQLPMEEALQIARSIARDPKYARAHASVADAHAYLGHDGLMPTALAARNADAAAERAVALDDGLADAHLSLGVTKLFFSSDLAGSERALRRAVALNPQHALARCYLALYLGTVERGSEARAEAERAMELEPLSPIVNAVAGIACYWADEFEMSLDACSRAVEIDPQFFSGLYGLGRAYEGLGRYDEAISAHERAAEIRRCPLVIMFLGGAYADAGRVDDARQVLEELKKLRTEAYTTALSLEYVYTKLGEVDLAIEWAAKAFEERNAFVFAGARFPGLERLASEPTYVALLSKARLESSRQ